MLHQKLKQAEEGRLFWRKLEEKNGKGGLYLLFCGDSPSLEQEALSQLEALKQERNPRFCQILSTQEKLGTEAQKITQEEQENLLSFYQLYQFTEDLILVSLESPHGSKLSHLKNAGMSEKDLVSHCLFRLSSNQNAI